MKKVKLGQFALCVFLLVLFSAFASAQPACGNRVCEAGENSCTCKEDCGLCAPSEGELCVAYSCTKENICQRSTIPLCCGNEICEKNEDYGNCQKDCVPTQVEIRLLKPLDKNFLRGELVVINALITSHGRETLATVATASGFFGSLELLNDSRHFDGNAFDSVYGNAFVVGKDINTGGYNVRVDANFRGARNSIDFNFNLNALLDAELSLFDSYYLGEEIDIHGRITGKGKPKKVPLDLNISAAGKKLFSQKLESSSAGNFSLPYHTSLIDPEGKWLIALSGRDENNNTVFVSKEVEVIKPPKERFLGIELLQDMNRSFPAGSLVEWFVRVKDRDRDVNGARVFLVDEQNNSFEFQERVPGKYSLSYRVPFQLGTGEKTFTIIAEKAIGNAKVGGRSEFRVGVEKSGLAVVFLKPVEKTVEAGKSLEIRVFVSYGDETPVAAAEVFAVIGGEKIRMGPTREGIFSLEYQPGPEGSGILQIEARAEDSFGNTGSAKTAVEVLSPGLSAVVQKNFWIIAAIIIIGALILFFTKEKLLAAQGVFSLEARKKYLIKMEEKLQEKYFRQRAIPRSDYKEQMDAFETELQEIESKLKGGKE